MTPQKLKPAVVQMLTERLGDEYKAHYFYKCAANYCNNIGFTKAGSFFTNESQSELEHAQGLMNYLIGWNIAPTIPKVDTNYTIDGLVDAIEKAYELEYDLFIQYTECSKKMIVADLNTFDFLQKYRIIQTDAVTEYSDFLNALELIDNEDKFQLFVFEKENFNV